MEFERHQHYILLLAGKELRCSFEFPQTVSFFGNYCEGPFVGPGDLYIPEEFWRDWQRDIGPRDAFNEYSAFACIASSELLHSDCCVMHAVAVRWNGRAFLIAAPPGVGKTTQYRTLDSLYPNEFGIICGDKPIVECRDDGTVTVHPSPWNGKENLYGAEASPLDSIILLERGRDTAFSDPPVRDYAAKLLGAILFNSDSEENIRQAAAFEEKLIKGSKVVSMVNGGIPDSSKQLYETILMEGKCR